MSAQDIVANLKKLFGEAHSPGQAFDAILALRRDGVTWDDAYKAVVTHGQAQCALQRLDETDDGSGSFPGATKADQSTPTFNNPKLGFGKYNGLPLLDIVTKDIDYVRWMEMEHTSPFWREQARLVLLAAGLKAFGDSRSKVQPMPFSVTGAASRSPKMRHSPRGPSSSSAS